MNFYKSRNATLVDLQCVTDVEPIVWYHYVHCSYSAWWTNVKVYISSEMKRVAIASVFDCISPPPPHTQLGAIGEAARACTQYFYYNPHNDAAKEKFHMYKRLRKVNKDDLKPAHILKYVSQLSPIAIHAINN